MREIQVSKVAETVKKLCIDANYYLTEDIQKRLEEAKNQEIFPIAQSIMDVLLENADIAKNEQRPMCQDTGMAVVFV
ncbi:MAG: fumarate hydratase, partial [Thermotaleaceae bacterium]